MLARSPVRLSPGIDVKGKVVAVQYGGSFRGLKVKAAAEAGAVGVVIFTDPIEDGNVVEGPDYAAYPAGPARAPSSVQRGSVQYLSLYPGDPLTPGQPSYNPSLPNAPKRLPRDGTSDEINIPSIPSIPLSYEDAIPLLKSLNGKGIKLEDGQRAGKKMERWREGGLRDKGVEYWTGPGEEVVELTNIVEEKVTPIWCVSFFLSSSSLSLLSGRVLQTAQKFPSDRPTLKAHAEKRPPSSATQEHVRPHSRSDRRSRHPRESPRCLDLWRRRSE